MSDSNPPGRPSKLTAEVRRRLLEATRSGCNLKDTAAYAGVTYDTLLNYRKNNAAFAEEFARAEGATAVGMALALKQAATAGDWRAALAWLERRRPEEWTAKQKVETSGKTEHDHTHRHTHAIDPDLCTTEELELLRRLAARHEAKESDAA